MIHHLYDIGPFRISIDTGSRRKSKPFRTVERSKGVSTAEWHEVLADATAYAVAYSAASGDMKPRMTEVPTPVYAGTSVICVHEGRMLVGKRGVACGHGRGFLSFPGGKMEQEAPDHPSDTDTAEAGMREFGEEVGYDCLIQYREMDQVSKMHPEVFTTNCHMVEDGVHYVTFYMPASPGWIVVPDQIIPAVEPTKCDGWEWMTLRQIASYLVGEDVNPKKVKIDDLIASIPEAKLQWMPLQHLIAHMPYLNIGWSSPYFE